MNRFVFDKVNIMLFIVGVILLIIGYLVMSFGDITISPIILMIAYLVFFPAAIIYGTMKKQRESRNKPDKSIMSSQNAGKRNKDK